MDNDKRIVEIFYNKKAKLEKSEEGLKFPGNTYFPYIEKFGMFLLRFLNANLETLETAYETFFFAYGFELLKELDEEYTFELKGKYKDNVEYISKVTKIYSDLQYQIQEIQQELTFSVNYIYNIEEKEKLCQNCGMYFIPSSRLDEIYCDYPKANGKTCREQGAVQAYNERLKQNKVFAEYRRLYQLKSMAVGRNKDNKQMKKDFDKWKKDAKDRVNKLKHGLLTEDEVYEWLLNNK